MRQLIALATVLATASTGLTGCIPGGGCGGLEDHATDGDWVVTRQFSYESPCPAFDKPEQLTISIRGEVVTALSLDVQVTASRVYQDGDRQLVELTVTEPWYPADPSYGVVWAPVTYQLELVPVTARLEGPVTASFVFDAPEAFTTCTSEGAASAGQVDG